jgi:nucleoside-diphosphate-sugar epimerase
MKVFVTGASGFVGSAVVKELLSAGIQVLGLVRSQEGAQKVQHAGAEVLLGDINDLDLIKNAATDCDAVIHTAFNHDFSQFKASCEADRIVIEAFGDALAGTDKPLVITSGIGLLRTGRLATEDDAVMVGPDVVPRAATEEACKVAAAKGVNVYTVRLPPSVHGAGDHGFVPIIIGMAKEKGQSAYIGEGHNRWPAVHRFDAAAVYRLIVEKRPAQKVYHAVAEEGIDFVNIAETISNGAQLPLVSVPADEAEKYFTWFTHFAAMDCAASSAKTRETLGWQPKHIGLLEDMQENYF